MNQIGLFIVFYVLIWLNMSRKLNNKEKLKLASYFVYLDVWFVWALVPILVKHQHFNRLLKHKDIDRLYIFICISIVWHHYIWYTGWIVHSISQIIVVHLSDQCLSFATVILVKHQHFNHPYWITSHWSFWWSLPP